MQQVTEKLQETLTVLKAKIIDPPQIGLVLGSGLGVLADEITDPIIIPYREIPHFPVSTVEGHAGRLIAGYLMGRRVITMQGRFHFYEGYSMEQVVYPVRVMSRLGIEVLIVTNAAGGINKSFQVADLMLIEDHINLTGTNPLIGPNDPALGPRFPDMNEAYSRQLLDLAKKVAAQQGIQIKSGVYAGLTGPTYETPAEVKYLRTIGADAAGMSTVPEVIAARHLGLKVLGVSCITNLAAGMTNQPLSHDEVIEAGIKVREKFSRLIKGIIQEV